MQNWKTSRRLLYISETFKIQFFEGFDQNGNSLLHIAVLSNVKLFNQYMTSEYSAIYKNLEVTNSESRSDLTNCSCCGRSAHALARKNVLAQQSTSSYLENVNWRMMFFMHNNFFRPERSETLELVAPESVRKNRSSCGRRGTLDICFFSSECVDFNLPRTP